MHWLGRRIEPAQVQVELPIWELAGSKMSEVQRQGSLAHPCRSADGHDHGR
jgi:hypothetical protein